MPTYILSAGPGKPKMTESESTGEGSCVPQPPPQNAAPGAPFYFDLKCDNITMAAFADIFQTMPGGYLDQPVVDETNLTGTWSFSLKWTARDQLEKQGADGISLFAAVEKELGLKLELKTAPRPVFQVVSVDEASCCQRCQYRRSASRAARVPFEVVVIQTQCP